MGTREHDVVVAGGGPVGTMLAAELALAGVDVVVVERRPDRELAGSRAGGLHARALEALDQRGVVERFLAEGQPAQVATFGTARLDMSDLPTRHPYTLGIWQNRIERILGDWLDELPARVEHGREVVGFAEDDTGVAVLLADGGSLRARYLVGCDGGRSLVRRAAGIEFPGWEATQTNLIAEVEVTEEPELGVRHDDAGTHGIGRVDYEIRNGEIVYADEGPVRVMLTEREVHTGEPTLDDLRAGLVAVYGTDFGVHSPTWISRFSDMTRQAAAYRKGRVLLAGDAAHVHSPAGGQGLSLGLLDAVNLGWKLALVARGAAPDELLDTYHAERHPAGERALRYTMAQSALQRRDERVQAAAAIVAEVAALDEPRRRLAAMVAGLDTRYDLGEGHPLLGRRMPDLGLRTAAGGVRVYELLHEARPVLLRFGGRGVLDPSGWAERVKRVDTAYDGAWELPAIGEVSAPTAVLVRPDGHVAWVGEGGDEGLAQALTKWFGPPRPDPPAT